VGRFHHLNFGTPYFLNVLMNFDNIRCFYSVQSFGEVVSFQGPEVKSKVEAHSSQIVLQWVSQYHIACL